MIATPARQSDKSDKGSSGGVSLHPFSQLAASAVDTSSAVVPLDWAVVWLNLPGTPVFVFTAYFEVGLGFKGACSERLTQMASLIALLDAPWLILAGWKAPR